MSLRAWLEGLLCCLTSSPQTDCHHSRSRRRALPLSPGSTDPFQPRHAPPIPCPPLSIFLGSVIAAAAALSSASGLVYSRRHHCLWLATSSPILVRPLRLSIQGEYGRAERRLPVASLSPIHFSPSISFTQQSAGKICQNQANLVKIGNFTREIKFHSLGLLNNIAWKKPPGILIQTGCQGEIFNR
jgi:hypothetical protein